MEDKRAMKKEVFISNLKKNLSVLEEKEIQDIIEEYEQHIDMKMEKGLSEEDAIADFGDLKELSAGILEAYHVKADYKQEKKNLDFGKMKEESIKATGKATNALGKAGQGIGKVLKKIGHGIGFVFVTIGTWICTMFRSIKNMIKLPFDKMKNKEKNKDLNQFQKKTNGTFLSKLGALFLNIGSCIGMFFVFCKNCIWNLFWILLGTCATVGTLGVIFLFGLSTVLLFMGYPVIGIEIVIIGLGLIGSTVMIFSFSMIKKIKEKKESITEEKNLAFDLMEVGQNA